MRPREKQIFVTPAFFISRFPPLLFYRLLLEKLKQQKPSVITFNAYINNYYSTFFSGDTFLHVRLTGVTFIK